MIFKKPENVKGLKKIRDVIPTIDPDNTRDYETIENFEIDGNNIYLSGEFGQVTLVATDWEFIIDNSN